MSKYTVVAILKSKAETKNELKEALEAVASPSRSEKTCIEYKLHQDLDTPENFVLYEIWESKEAHQKQFEKPYITELGKKIGDMLAAPYQLFCLNEIG